VHSGRTPEAWGEEAVTPPVPPPAAMLLGDFNMEPDSEEYQGLVAPSGGADGAAADFVDAWLAAGGDPEAGATLLTDAARTRGKRIDYCFVTRDLAGQVASVRVDIQAGGSDHQPVIVRFNGA
jgi:endonuclease/exonuclease/phosphatase family metal-dependent hydrolase